MKEKPRPSKRAVEPNKEEEGDTEHLSVSEWKIQIDVAASFESLVSINQTIWRHLI
jgi:hypothetical protein